MAQHDPITQIQLALFKRMEHSMFIGESVYICDDFSSDIQLPDYVYGDNGYIPFPFKLTFTAAIVCVQGELNAIINQRLLSVSRGGVIIAQFGSIVENLTSSPDLKTISMAFTESKEGWGANHLAEKLGNWFVHRSVPFSLQLDESQLQRYLNLYTPIKVFYDDTPAPLKGEIIKGLISISIASFLSFSQSSLDGAFNSRSESRQEEVFLRFMDDLQLYASRERSVKFYSDRLCISPKYFSKLVRQASGKLPMEHIQQRVIIEAKTLLCTTDMTISEIADTLNFPTDSFFCRYFKHETGCSPSEYRAKPA